MSVYVVHPSIYPRAHKLESAASFDSRVPFWEGKWLSGKNMTNERKLFQIYAYYAYHKLTWACVIIQLFA